MKLNLFLAVFFLSALFVPQANSKDLPEYPSQASMGYHTIEIQRGDTLAKLFGEHASTVARFNRIDPTRLAIGLRIKVPNDLSAAENYTPMPKFLPEAANEERYALINLAEQFLGAYEYGELKFSVPVSSAAENCRGVSGRWKKCSTPTGEFRAGALHRDHISSIYKSKMPYSVLFTIQSGIMYWIHGGALPGHPDSHGCIRATNEDAKTIFTWFGGNPADGKIRWVKDGFPIRIVNAEKM